MGSRERKRAELAKRKQRAGQRAPVGATPETGAPAPEGPSNGAPVSRSELRNQQAREALEPLGEGERPTVVTIGAVIAGLLAVSSLILYAAGVELSGEASELADEEVDDDGERPSVLQLIGPLLLMGTMAWGMWRARYWAVLGFQALMLILILFSALSLVQATEVVQAIVLVIVLGVSGTLFYFMVKALARIQMPERQQGR
jgi:hypothetical protein